MIELCNNSHRSYFIFGEEEGEEKETQGKLGLLQNCLRLPVSLHPRLSRLITQ